MSVIYYKFKSAKDFETVTFDGAGLPLGELKLEILNHMKVGKVADFDLIVTNAQSNEEYKNEYSLVPKNTSVVIRRVPANKSSQFAVYMMNRRDTTQPSSATTMPSAMPLTSHAPQGSLNEADRIRAVVEQTSKEWQQGPGYPPNPHHPYANNAHSFNGNGNAQANYRPRPRFLNSGPPPDTYLCFRCGRSGHWISDCPTNNDPSFNMPKIKRALGIPKTFLKETQLQDTASSHPDAPAAPMLVNSDGKFVVVQSRTGPRKQNALVATVGSTYYNDNDYDTRDDASAPAAHYPHPAITPQEPQAPAFPPAPANPLPHSIPTQNPPYRPPTAMPPMVPGQPHSPALPMPSAPMSHYPAAPMLRPPMTSSIPPPFPPPPREHGYSYPPSAPSMPPHHPPPHGYSSSMPHPPMPSSYHSERRESYDNYPSNYTYDRQERAPPRDHHYASSKDPRRADRDRRDSPERRPYRENHRESAYRKEDADDLRRLVERQEPRRRDRSPQRSDSRHHSSRYR